MSPHDRSIYSIYFNGGVREIIPIYPLYAVMFTEHGISPIELATLFVIWALVGIVFEVPSGALADRFSRKWLVVASGVFKASGFVCWFLFQDFAGYAFGFFLWGLGSTLRSGAWEALLHDLLAAVDKELTFTRHYGRIAAFGTLGVMLGELAGGLLIVNGYDTVLLASALAPLLATIPVVLFVRDKRPTGTAESEDYFATLRAGLGETIRNKVILYILCAVSLLVVIFGVYDEYSGVLLREKHFSLAMIAYLGVPIFLAQSLGQAFAERFSFLSLRQLLIVIALASATLLAMPFLEGFWIPVLLTGYFLIFGVSATLLQGYLHAAIEGEARATIASVVGLGEGVGAIVWFMVFGAMAETTTIANASFGLGASAILLAILLAVLGAYWRINLKAD